MDSEKLEQIITKQFEVVGQAQASALRGADLRDTSLFLSESIDKLATLLHLQATGGTL